MKHVCSACSSPDMKMQTPLNLLLGEHDQAYMWHTELAVLLFGGGAGSHEREPRPYSVGRAATLTIQPRSATQQTYPAAPPNPKGRGPACGRHPSILACLSSTSVKSRPRSNWADFVALLFPLPCETHGSTPGCRVAEPWAPGRRI